MQRLFPAIETRGNKCFVTQIAVVFSFTDPSTTQSSKCLPNDFTKKMVDLPPQTIKLKIPIFFIGLITLQSQNNRIQKLHIKPKIFFEYNFKKVLKCIFSLG